MSAVATAIVGSAVVSGVAANSAAKKQAGAAGDASQVELEQYYQNRDDMRPWREAGEGALSLLSRGLGIQGLPSQQAETFEQIRQRLMPNYTDPQYGGNGVDDRGLLAATQREFESQDFRRQQQPAGEGSGIESGEFLRDFSMADFEKDPSYLFRQDEGRKAIEGGAAGRGGLLSGATLKALSKYGQGLASEEYGNAYNRYNANLDRRFNRLSGIAGTGQTATRDTAQMGSQVASNVGQNIIGAGNARASGYVGVGNAIGGAAQGYTNYSMLKDVLGRQQPTPWTSTGAGFPSGTGY